MLLFLQVFCQNYIRSFFYKITLKIYGCQIILSHRVNWTPTCTKPKGNTFFALEKFIIINIKEIFTVKIV